MADLTPTRTFYEAQSRDALGLAFVASLRRLQSAQEDAEKASVMCAGRDYEICHHAVLDERKAAFRIANQLGLDMRVIERAVQ